MEPYDAQSETLIERLLTRDMLAGDFDPSFGVGGVFADPIVHESGSLDRVVETVLDPQGRVLVAANVETGRGIIASVSRFLPGFCNGMGTQHFVGA